MGKASRSVSPSYGLLPTAWGKEETSWVPWELREAKSELGSTGHHEGNGNKEGMGHKS